MNLWRRYWFDEGGRLSIACIRVAIAIAVLMVLWHIHVFDLSAPSPLYRALGVWLMFPGQPGAAIVTVLWIVAWVSTFAMLVGAGSRIATAVSCVSSLALVSLTFANVPPVGRWSHGYNVVFLAHIALLGARCGDTFSVDALVRRWRGLPAFDIARGYQWSVRLVTFAVALMFIGACAFKIGAGHGLGWALSDNLRHQLLVRYDLAGLPRPAVANWIMAEAWRYKTAATLNMLTQLAPLLAVVMPRRPLVRAAVAVLFITEAVAIDAIMALPNIHWVPLAAVFIDWDRLFKRAPKTLVDTKLPKAPQIFIAAFIAFDLVVTFVPRLDQKLGAYPFSSFPLFATVRAAHPWSEHRPYAVAGDHFVTTPSDPKIESALDHENRRLFNETDPDALKVRLQLLHEQTNRDVRHYLALFVAPAYPAPPRFDRNPIAITGEVGPAGFRTVLGTWTRTSVTLRPVGVDTTNARLVYYTDEGIEPQPLLGTRHGDTFDVALPSNAAHVVAIIGDEPWLVASMRRRR